MLTRGQDRHQLCSASQKARGGQGELGPKQTPLEPSLTPPAAPGASPMAKKRSFTFIAVLADVSMNNRLLSSA